jgi:hypothetical protein
VPSASSTVLAHIRAKCIEPVGFQASVLADVSRISQVAVGPDEVDPPISMILVSPGSSTEVSVTPRPAEFSCGPLVQVAVAGLRNHVVAKFVQASKPLVVSFIRG